MFFEDETFENVNADLEKAYEVKFNVTDKALLNQKITTSFRKAPFEEVIEVLEILLHHSIIKTEILV